MTRCCTDRLDLSIGEIHVWTARLVDDRQVAAALLPLLSQEERARAAQLSFERDRVRFIQAHGRVRQILFRNRRGDAHLCTEP
jgi:phosphopantetheinyl transferase